MTDHLLFVRKVMINFLWVPLVLDILSSYYEDVPSSWKFLFLILGLTISQHNISILLMKMFFLIDYIKFDKQNIKGILVTSIWTYTASMNTQFGGG